MQGTLDVLEERANVVELEAGLQRAQVTGLHPEGRARLPSRRSGKSAAECLVHDVAEAAAGAFYLGPELGGDVFVKSQRGTHILMLAFGHHDVNAASQAAHGRPVRPPRCR